jgi:hypothetical protein
VPVVVERRNRTQTGMLRFPQSDRTLWPPCKK